MPLSQLLPPGIAGYEAGRQANQQADEAQLGGLAKLLQIHGVMQQQQEAAKARTREDDVRKILADSGGDVEKAMNALIQGGNVAGAHQLAPILALQQKAKEATQAREGLAAIFGQQPAQTAPQAALAAGAAQGDVGPTVTNDARIGTVPVAPAAPAGPPVGKAARLEQLQKMSIAYANNPVVMQRLQAEMDKLSAESAPMVEHRFPVKGVNGEPMIQPHVSQDRGLTWKPMEGSSPSPAFAKQVAPVVKVGGDTAKFSNVQPDGQGGWLGLNKSTGRMEKIPAAEGVQAAGVLPPEAIRAAGERYAIDGTFPPNLGKGAQGPSNTAKILSAAADVAKERGDSAEEARIRQIAGKAATTALVDITKRESQVSAFEKTFVKNTELVESLSAKVDRTGVPLLNKWIQGGKRAVMGDVDLTNLDTAIKGAVNEYAKIVSGSMGNVATAEGEIKKIESLLSAAQTPDQIKGILTTMRTETQNRMSGFREQKNELNNVFRTSGRRSGDATVLRFDAQGNPVQ